MLQESKFEPCQVCGEQSSGLHCNAVTCEACKKFFLRSIHGEHKKYKCARNKDCVMTRNTRTQCQYCRFNKCLAVGMTAKADDTQTPTVIDLFKQISCYVCGAPSSGIHFGAITCEGCKGFFRRSIKERAPSRYKCTENGLCDVNVATRNGCKHCRFQKCLKVGMSVDASRIGRQSNLFKHHIMMMQKNGQIPSTMLHAMSNNTATARRGQQKRRAESCSSTENAESAISSVSYEQKLSESQREQLNTIYAAFKENLQNLPLFGDHKLNAWLAAMDQLRSYATACVKFATNIEGFTSFPNNDQMVLIRSAIHAVIILTLSRNRVSSWNYMNCATDSGSKKIQQLLPAFDQICAEIDTSELVQWVDRLCLDTKEFALLLAILIVSAANRKLISYKTIDPMRTDLTLLLLEYMDCKRGERCRDFYTVMLIIPKLRRLNMMVQRELMDDVSSHAEVSYPSFFWKVFVGKEIDADIKPTLLEGLQTDHSM